MAYFDNTNNANFYFTSSAPEALYTYPVLSQPSTGEGVDKPTTFAYYWSTAEQLGPTVGSATDSQVAANYEPTVTSPYTRQADGYAWPTYPGHHSPMVGQQAQSYYSGFMSQDDSFASTLASEASTVVPAPSSGPLNYWGENQSGPSTSTFYAQNVLPSYQPGTGPTRTGLIPTGRSQPYGASRARANEHRNAEAGPSTLVPPPVPYLGPPTPQPSGGTSETTADAEKEQTITEENKTTTTKRAKRPYGKGPPRPHREGEQKDLVKLRAWVQQQKRLEETPTVSGALAVMAEMIPTIRPLESLEPRLLTGKGRRTVDSDKAKVEFGRRNAERRLLQELSRYYPLEGNQSGWTRSSLISQVVKDLEVLSALPGPSNDPHP